MTEKTEAAPAAEQGAGELRGKLVTRLAMAGLLVAVLLGILAMFDYLATAPDESESPVFEQPVPVAPRKEVSRPVTPADNLPEPPVAAEPAAAEPAAAPASPPAAAAAASAPAAAAAPATENATPAPSTASRRAPLTASVREAAPVPEATRSAPMVPERAPAVLVESAPQRPAVRIEPRSAVAAPPPAPLAQRLFSGFVLQAGVFSSIQRAEELHARLTLSGVPSTLEARVQVGPFRTRQEAEAAQTKLRELGIQAILVPPRGARR